MDISAWVAPGPLQSTLYQLPSPSPLSLYSPLCKDHSTSQVWSPLPSLFSFPSPFNQSGEPKYCSQNLSNVLGRLLSSLDLWSLPPVQALTSLFSTLLGFRPPATPLLINLACGSRRDPQSWLWLCLPLRPHSRPCFSAWAAAEPASGAIP